MNVKLLLLITYSVFLIVYASFLVFQAIKFKSKFGYLCECSGLGEAKSGVHKAYNIGYFIFGILSICFTYILNDSLISNPISIVGIVFLYIASFSLVFIAIFPLDIHYNLHAMFSASLFVGIIISFLLLSISFIRETWIPNWIILINLWVASTLSYYFYIKIRDIKKYGLHNGREKYVSIYEWIPFLSGFVWNFLMSLLLITQKF